MHENVLTSSSPRPTGKRERLGSCPTKRFPEPGSAAPDAARPRLLPALPLRRAGRQRHRVQGVRPLRRAVGQPLDRRRQLPADVRGHRLLGLGAQHGLDRRPPARVLLPGPARPRPAAAQPHLEQRPPVRAVGGLSPALHLVGDRRRPLPAAARRHRTAQLRPRRHGVAHRRHHRQPRRLQAARRRAGHLEGQPAGARSSSSRPSPRSTSSSTRPPRSTAPDPGGASGTSPCPPSAR